MISLYDYLGRAAGLELGGEVYSCATEKGEMVGERFVNTPYYTGKVAIYERSFLEDYFRNN